MIQKGSEVGEEIYSSHKSAFEESTEASLLQLTSGRTDHTQQTHRSMRLALNRKATGEVNAYKRCLPLRRFEGSGA